MALNGPSNWAKEGVGERGGLPGHLAHRSFSEMLSAFRDQDLLDCTPDSRQIVKQ